MVKALQKAIAEVQTLPDSDQEEIARKLISHVEKLRALRADIDAGLRSLDEGKSKPLDIDQFLDEMNRRDSRK
jgi:Arc/MetJ-type ribon-helix-helix transcriptional regulator